MKPRVEIIALGGTIACRLGPAGTGVAPSLTAADLVDAIPALTDRANIGARNLANAPSTEIDLRLLLTLAAAIRKHEEEGIDGIVVTQGTDTIEETAFVLDLLYQGQLPVVITGAMRNPSLPGADGPANLLAAVSCAASPVCRNLGVLVAFDDMIHAARWVQKRHTSATGAFWSPAPLGWLADEEMALYARPERVTGLDVSPEADVPFVPILKPGISDQPRLVDAAISAGAAGLVVELAGGGHVHSGWLGALREAAERVPVVYSSRTRGGRVLRKTYSQVGGEMDLISRGLTGSGDLDALKARLLLMLLLMVGRPDDFATRASLSMPAFMP